MPAAVESGVFNVERGLPWHGLGTANTGFMVASELLAAAGLDWLVEKRGLYTTTEVEDGCFDDTVEVPDYFAVVRMSDDKPLGVVGNRYVPAQNNEVLSFMDNLIGTGQAAYDTAWSLRGGRTVAITAELGERTAPAEGEEIRTFLTAMNTHDGSGKIRIIVSPIRVVCMNTLALANRQARYTWERKHTFNALSEANVKEAREALVLAEEYQRYITATGEALLSEAFGRKDFFALATDLLIGDIEEEEVSTQQKNKIEDLLAVYTNSENLNNIRDTKWGAWNAVVEWVDYCSRYRGKNVEDNRAESIMYGRGVEVKTRAFEMLTN